MYFCNPHLQLCSILSVFPSISILHLSSPWDSGHFGWIIISLSSCFLWTWLMRHSSRNEHDITMHSPLAFYDLKSLKSSSPLPLCPLLLLLKAIIPSLSLWVLTLLFIFRCRVLHCSLIIFLNPVHMNIETFRWNLLKYYIYVQMVTCQLVFCLIQYWLLSSCPIKIKIKKILITLAEISNSRTYIVNVLWGGNQIIPPLQRLFIRSYRSWKQDHFTVLSHPQHLAECSIFFWYKSSAYTCWLIQLLYSHLIWFIWQLGHKFLTNKVFPISII